VVDRVARLCRKTKVGHAGTLDPLASGVLVICVGAATRLIEYVQRMPKAYQTVVRLGARSDTLDRDGQVVETPDPMAPSMLAVRTAVAAQVGTLAQVPPQFSALKVAGQRAYDLARAGVAVDLAPREVVVKRVEILSYMWPNLELEVDCGGGTYIRSIARDVGETLGCGGLVDVLTRTRIGHFGLDDAVVLDQLTWDSLPGFLRPSVEAIGDLPRLPISDAQVADVTQGRPLDGFSVVGAAFTSGEVALMGPGGELVAVAKADASTGRIQPKRVLAQSG
jgi:tRNA pseudouridine55 synthase